MFFYKSALTLSKSWLNRAQVIQFYNADLKIETLSDSDDVVYLKKALQQIGKKNSFNLGQGGTSFRFFCFLISKLEGSFQIYAHPRIFERPQKDLEVFLKRLGVKIKFNEDSVQILSNGWKIPQHLDVDAQDSSQFISALLLNSWKLSENLKIVIQKPITSEDYFRMTLKILKNFKMKIKLEETPAEISILIEANQIPSTENLHPELDMSSAFSLAAAAVIDGNIEITNWIRNSIQPDSVFLKLFDQMQINYYQDDTVLKIVKQDHWNSIEVNLSSYPDLFPVLSVLCAMARGSSHLFGAVQLKSKESNRLIKTKELLDLTGFQSVLEDGGIVIEGLSSSQDKAKHIIFNPDHDHRMAMAAGLMKLKGFNIQILHPEVVTKSFPTFWKDIGVIP